MKLQEPRHGVNIPSDLPDHLPQKLKDRFRLETIMGSPPGYIRNGSNGPEYDHVPKSWTKLFITCDNNSIVEVDYINYLISSTFMRDGQEWYMIHTWTRTYGPDSMHKTVWVNLETGENHITKSLSKWRNNLEISPDGKLASLSYSIECTSSVAIEVYDISNLEDIKSIYYHDYSSHFKSSIEFSKDDPLSVVIIFEYSKEQYEYYYLEQTEGKEEPYGYDDTVYIVRVEYRVCQKNEDIKECPRHYGLDSLYDKMNYIGESVICAHCKHEYKNTKNDTWRRSSL
jgi:hypothetical protein